MRLLFFIFLISFPIICFAQKDTFKIFYDENYQIIENDTNYSYYSLTWAEGAITYTNLYFKNGTLKEKIQKKKNKRHGPYFRYTKYGQTEWEGQYKNGNKTGIWKEYHPDGSLFAKGRFQQNKAIGIWKFYHENGQLSMKQRWKKNKQNGKEISYFSNGNLFSKGKNKANKRIGKWKWYHENGAVKSEGVLSHDGYKIKQWNYYHENGNLLCYCIFEDNPNYNKYYAGSDSSARYFIEETIKQSPSIQQSFNWEQGFLKGKQVYYHPNGTIAAEEWYSNGKLDSLKNWDTEGNEIPAYLDENGTMQVPYFNGNFQAFEDSVKIYPEEALNNNIHGTVYIIFNINADASLSEFRVLESPSPILSAEALRILKASSGRWTPGKKHNTATSIKYGVDIEF